MSQPEPEVVYVAGFARSGSTLLGEIVAASDPAFHAGELLVGLRWLAQGKRGRCSCGDELANCEVWASVFSEFPELIEPSPRRAAVLNSLIKEPMIRCPSPTPDQWEIARLVQKLYGRVATVTGCDVVVDSSKSILLGRLLNAYVLHLVREPRAAVHSRNRSARQRGRLTAGSPREVQSIAADSLRWAAVNRAQRATAQTAAIVRYEDLVSPGWRCNIAGLDVRVDPFLRRTSRGHFLVGNPSFRRSTPRHVKPDVAWRTEMPSWQQTVVRAITSVEYRQYVSGESANSVSQLGRAERAESD